VDQPALFAVHSVISNDISTDPLPIQTSAINARRTCILIPDLFDTLRECLADLLVHDLKFNQKLRCFACVLQLTGYVARNRLTSAHTQWKNQMGRLISVASPTLRIFVCYEADSR
jgi:hypothetical protein